MATLIECRDVMSIIAAYAVEDEWYNTDDIALAKWLRLGQCRTDDLLINAVHNGNVEMAKYLIESGADVHTCNDEAVWLAAMFGNLRMVKYLISCGASARARNSDAVVHAAENGYIEIVKHLVAHGADVRTQNDRPIKCALVRKNRKMVEYLESLGC
jgi:ankyrin repeat protein